MFPTLNILTWHQMNYVGAFWPGVYSQYNSDYMHARLLFSKGSHSAQLNWKVEQVMMGIGVLDTNPTLNVGYHARDMILLVNLWKDLLLLGATYNMRHVSASVTIGKLYDRPVVHSGFLIFYMDLGFGSFISSDGRSLGLITTYTYQMFNFSGAVYYSLSRGNIGVHLGFGLLFSGNTSRVETVRIDVPVYLQIPVERTTVRPRSSPGRSGRVRSGRRGGEDDTSKVVVRDPKMAAHYYKKGLDAYAKGEYEKALEYFEKALYYDPNHKGAKRAYDRLKKLLGR